MIVNANNIEHAYYKVQLISAQDTYTVRQPVLRTGRPIKDCVFEGDNLKTTFHLGLFLNENLIGVASYMKNTNAIFSEDNQYQLRGMAILEDYQKKGLGTLLLQAGKEKLTQMKVERLWFNAREIAVKFYKNHGYKTIGEPFTIEGVGIHFLMTE